MIKYITSLKNINENNLKGFFIGWPNSPSPKTHLKILKNSYKVVIAVDCSSSQVVGFINAISDGYLSAYIPLLEVLPNYQKQGIGLKLIQLMLKELKNIYMIDLLCDKKLKKFYKKAGMKETFGMLIRNFAYQSGLKNGKCTVKL